MVDGSTQFVIWLAIAPEPLGAWKNPSLRIWRVCYNKEDGVVEVLSDQDSVLLYEPGQRMRFRKLRKTDYDVPKGVSAVVTVIDKDSLKLVQTGQQKLAPKREDEDRLDFMDFLHEWGGKYVGRVVS